MTLDTSNALEIRFHSSISEIDSDAWNQLAGTSSPFIRYEFLRALENHQCVGKNFGWLPHHIAIYDHTHKIVGLCPLYIKYNSYGEFVFDWSWASAYEQAGINYYPKMVCSVPYNPVSGARLLSKDLNIKHVMVKQIIKEAKRLNMSGMHWLFTNKEDTSVCESNNLMLRLGCQYHWHNHDYNDFEHFLSTFVSRKRKKVKRERRMVNEQNIRIEIVHGNEASEQIIDKASDYYERTFDQKYGIPTLNQKFFREICSTMGHQVVFFVASLNQETIACAICLRSDDTLYGRFWGCEKEFHSLHFETCFYQGIDYCIAHKLKSFEPGAQGEHKITRGFLPTKTWSAHWIADSQFQPVLHSFCQREQQAMRDQCDELYSLSPYRMDK